mmetsp:Transcript_53689/g.126343  ORF Transcript_53689/g.126343 Transcript_53689/m.126343 type:complete len:324 (-) Transcript_53689:290-1261(-)
MVRVAGDEGLEGRNRVLVVALAVLRIAKPEADRVGVAAGGVPLQEGVQRGHGLGEIAAAHEADGGVVLAALLGPDLELAPIETDPLRLQRFEPGINGLRLIGQLALGVGQVTRELLVGATQLGDLGAQRVDLRVQVQHAAPQRLDLILDQRVELLGTLVGEVFIGLHLATQLEDGLAGLVVLEQPGTRRLGQGHARGERHERQTQNAHHLSLSSTRRFLAQASSVLPCTAGRSLPKLTASTWAACTPSSVSDFATASARRWPRARLYSRPPRSSVWPSRFNAILRLLFRRLACRSTSGRNSSLTTSLSKSKYTTRLSLTCSLY